MEEIEALKAEGASEQELNDPGVADLALRKIFEEHFEEIRTDPNLTDETFAVVSRRLSPRIYARSPRRLEKKASLN